MSFFQKRKMQTLPGPDLAQLKTELRRERYKSRYRRVLRSTFFTLVVVAAAAVLAATLWLPVLQIYGSSMTPTLQEGEIVVSVKGSKFEHGDVVGLYFGNKLLIKRCIGIAGDWVDMDEAGNVYINGEPLEEPYLNEKAFGTCDLELPYQVPDNTIFVMGDHRETSVDSRSAAVGCIDTDEIVGKIVYRVWPLERFGSLSQ